MAARDSGIGASNVHSRLSLIYGNSYSVNIKSGPGRGTSMIIDIPCES